MKFFLSLILSFPIIFIIMFLANFFKIMGHLMIYKIFFKDDDYFVNLGLGKVLYKNKKTSIHILPVLSQVSYGNKFKRGTLKSIATYLSGSLGILFNFILLIPLIYVVNMRQDLIYIIHIGILPYVIRIMAYYNLFLLVWDIIPFQLPYIYSNGYTSNGYYLVEDLRSLKRKDTK
ncbi:hypothetical protein [Finegoldia magna]|uniref:hypothetical protein n=1 Tax=Finegoldia magna TaxID=1260 RepID=UPI00290F4553|nr:hypothetical protein [Finegoldia magna]MDU5508187.1 hypothetical protein [Finegoldia magna]